MLIEGTRGRTILSTPNWRVNFASGQKFLLKPKVSSEISIERTDVQPDCLFVDITRFPMSTMYGSHEIINCGHELEVKTTISIEGALSFLSRKLVAEDIVKGLSEKTNKLVERGVSGGFCQLRHGKAQPLKRMLVGDWIIYYSPMKNLRAKRRTSNLRPLVRWLAQKSINLKCRPASFPIVEIFVFWKSPASLFGPCRMSFLL
jgi:hypothetical protein